jgi:hypothetical protein
LLCFGNFRNGATAVSKDRYSRCRGQWQLLTSKSPCALPSPQT